MKVILNKDLAPLGEEGDVKDVAKGYARNFLFPRNIALPYNDRTVKLFESRRHEIEERKAQKRTDAAGLKEKLESLNLEITMPAGPNGKLYGAVTSQTVMDELAKQSFKIERKRIDLTSIKNIGKYKATVKLYENSSAEITINVLGQEIKTETKPSASARPGRRHRESSPNETKAAPVTNETEGRTSAPSGVTETEASASKEAAAEVPQPAGDSAV